MSAIDWSQPRRVLQHLLREDDARDLDPAELITEAQACGADTLLVMGGGFSAWYPTELPYQRANPAMSDNLLSGIARAAKAAGLAVIGRLDLSKGRAEWVTPHPDWFARNLDGTVRFVWDMPVTCPTGPVWREGFAAITREMFACAPLDGVFLNYLTVPRCHCPRCCGDVRAATGADPPAEGSTPAYDRWRAETLTATLHVWRAQLKSITPHAVLIPYHHVREAWDLNAVAAESDLVSSQISNPVVVNPVDPQPAWRHWAAEEALLARAVKPDTAPLLVQSTSAFFASRATASPPDRLVRNLVEAAAHGAGTVIAVSGKLAGTDPRHKPGLKALGRYLSAQAPWYRDLTSLARVAILRSEASIRHGPDAGKAAGSGSRDGHIAEFRGMFAEVAAAGYPVALRTDGGLDAKSLATVSLVVLPAVSYVSSADATVLDAYVSDGGHVLATADCAAGDENGRPHPHPVMAALPWLPGPARNVAGGYLACADSDLRAALGVSIIGVDGDFWAPAVAAERVETTDLELLGPVTANAPEFALVPTEPGAPGFIRRRHGGGSATWLPWRIGASCHRNGILDHAAVLRWFLRNTLGRPPFEVLTGDAVTATLYGHPRGRVLHLFNDAVPVGRPLLRCVPIADVAVRVRGSWARIERLDGGLPPRVTTTNGDTLISIERLESFAAFALISGVQGNDITGNGR